MVVGGGGPELIEVGSSRDDGTIRYWLAKEGVRQGELRLAFQGSSLGGLTASAASLLGWIVSISLALAAVIASALAPASATSPANAPSLLRGLLWPAVAAEVAMLFAAICCCAVLWPPPGLVRAWP